MTKWQPIETAPRDGTKALLFSRSGQYVGSYRLPMMGDPQYASYYEWEWRDGGGRWATPTHWQPLPEPPAE